MRPLPFRAFTHDEAMDIVCLAVDVPLHLLYEI
jgi:hypothetical protein